MLARNLCIAAGAVVAFAAPGSAQRTDDADIIQIHTAALGVIRDEFTSGRIVLDRVIIDTTTRLGLPLVSKQEHLDPELWTYGLGIETANTDYVQPVCTDIVLGCRLPDNIRVTVGMSPAVVRGDTARVIIRFSENTGTLGHGVRTTVEELTIVRAGHRWKVSARRVRAVA
jgi:hypothetical protein